MIKHISGITKKGLAIRLLGVVGVLIVLIGILAVPIKYSMYAATGTKHYVHPLDNPGDWSTYMEDNARDGFNAAETTLNAGNASTLHLHWKFSVGMRMNTQPIVANGMIYFGAYDGYEYALDLNGNIVWKTYIGKITVLNSGCNKQTVGVASSATIAMVTINGTPTTVDFVGGGDAHFYALDASNGPTGGHILWSTQLGSSPDHMIWDSPAVYNGSVYIGLSSFGDCPLVQGQLIQMDGASGTILHTFTDVPSNCLGGGIWGAPSIDEANNAIYVATGNPQQTCITTSRGYSVVKLSTTDLSVISFWQIPASQIKGDSDFGSSPTLFSDGTRSLLGVVNKSGNYYALDRADIAAGWVWRDVLSGGFKSLSAGAFDGTKLYVGNTKTTINGQTCSGSVRALNPATGVAIWGYCSPGKVVGAVSAVPGLVIVGADANLIVLDAMTGKQLFLYKDVSSGSQFWGSTSVSNGMLYATNQDGNFVALGL